MNMQIVDTYLMWTVSSSAHSNSTKHTNTPKTHQVRPL